MGVEWCEVGCVKYWVAVSVGSGWGGAGGVRCLCWELSPARGLCVLGMLQV